jgi:hypothetical protein
MYYTKARKKVVEEIIDAKNFTVGNDYTELNTGYNALNNLSPYYIEKIIKQFELDGKLKVIKEEKSRLGFAEKYILEIPNISYFENLIGYKEEIQNKVKDIQLELSIRDTAVYLNDIFLVSTTKFGFENYEIIKYLLENPNKKITRKELIDNTNLETVNKSFSKVVENLKFKGDLRKVFFKVSKTGIILFNPVSMSRLEELGLNHINLFSEE